MSTPAVALRCQALVKRFADTIAVDHLDLTVPTGTIFGLLGPNGPGKTSAIRTMLGIYVPDAGSVEVLGSSDPMAVRHRIGYLPEERGLYAKMKVIDQLASWRRSADSTRKRRPGGPAPGWNGSGWRTAPSRRQASCRRGCSRRSSSPRR